jgi:hypothetical protein
MIDEFLHVVILDANLSKYFFSFVRPAIAASILLIIGLGVISRISARGERWLFPLAPLIGFAAVVIVGSNLGLMFGVRAPLLLALTLAVSTREIWKYRENLRSLNRGYGRLLLIGFIVTVGIGNLPQSRVEDGRTLNHVSNNHDAIYYASNEAWVATHAYSQRPQILDTGPNGQQTPGKSSAVVAHEFNVRQGDALVAAFINSFIPSKYSYDWYSMRTTWLWLGFCSLLSAGMILKLRQLEATVAALIAASSWQMIFQMYNQNAPAIIGLSIVGLLLALATAVRKEENIDHLKIIAVVMSIAILITTYGELLPIAGMAFIFGITSKKLFTAKMLRALLIAGVCGIALVPFASFQTYRTIVRVGGLANSLGAPQFWNRSVLTSLKEVFGIPLLESWGSLLLSGVLVLLAIGYLATSIRLRSLAPFFFLSSLVFIWWRLGTQGAFYSVDRLVQTTVPIVIWIGVLGLLDWPFPKSKLIELLRFSPCLILFVNLIAPIHFLHSSGKLDGRGFLTSLSNYVSTAVKQTSNGERLMIHTNNYVDRLWLTNITNENDGVEYAFLTPDYFFDLTRFDDRASDQLLLTNLKPIGPKVSVTSRLLGSDYAIYDFKNGSGAILVPSRQDQTQISGNEILGSGSLDFRILCWSVLAATTVKLEITGVSGDLKIFRNSELETSAASNQPLSIQIRAGTNDIRIESSSRSSERQWHVKLISINNEKETRK